MFINRILVPTDFSLPATHAAQYAADLAEATGASLKLLHISNEEHTQYHLSWEPTGLQVEEVSEQENARSQLRRLAATFTARDIPSQISIVGPSDVVSGILEAAAHADLIVLASQTQTDPRIATESISLSVAHKAPCPVLLVDVNASLLTHGLRVMVPTDLSEASAAALRYARDLSAVFDGKVQLVHALSDSTEAATWGGEAVEADDELPESRRLRYVERFVEATGGASVPLEVRLVEGAPVEALARVASEDHPDLVVVGQPPDRPEAPDLIVEAMMAAAPCPALRAPLS